MSAYKGFAKLYDEFMDDIPYDEWSEYILCVLRSSGISDGHILELGCGTGLISMRLAKGGYKVTGIDISNEMVKIAGKKKIPDFKADVWDMRVPYPCDDGFDAVVSLCDSMNYLVEDYDLQMTFGAVADELKPGGLFVFDMKTPQFYEEELGDGIFADNRGHISYIWENCFDSESGINEYDITFYKQIIGGFYRRFTEHHVQRAYEDAVINDAAISAGFTFVGTKKKDERKYYIFKKKNI